MLQLHFRHTETEYLCQLSELRSYVTDYYERMVRAQLIHHLMPVLIAYQCTIPAIRARILDIVFYFRLDDAQLPETGIYLGQCHFSFGEAAVYHNSIVVHDLKNLWPQCPLGTKAPRRKAEIAAVDPKCMIVRILYIRELVDLLMYEGSHAHQKRIQIRHHYRLFDGAINYICRKQCQRIAFTCPYDIISFEQHIPRQARRSVTIERFIQA